MGFSITTRHLPRINTFEQAAGHYDSITPIRGSDNLRPLGNRQARHMRITRIDSNRGTKYELWLYNTPVVTFYEDGRVEFDVRYVSQSTAKFASKFVGYGGFGVMGDYIAYCRQGTTSVRHDGMFMFSGGVLQTPASKLYAKRLDRVKAKAARATFAPFVQWLDTVGALLIASMTEASYTALTAEYKIVPAAEFLSFAVSGDEGKWMHVLRSSIEFRHRAGFSYISPVNFMRGHLMGILEDAAYAEAFAHYWAPVDASALRSGMVWRTEESLIRSGELPC